MHNFFLNENYFVRLNYQMRLANITATADPQLTSQHQVRIKKLDFSTANAKDSFL